MEDPATLWSLGPERYTKLAGKYSELTGGKGRIAVDINIVDRYQDVYPTKKQTGLELLELVHQASESFPRVALYFENSLEKQDLGLLAAAATNQWHCAGIHEKEGAHQRAWRLLSAQALFPADPVIHRVDF